MFTSHATFRYFLLTTSSITAGKHFPLSFSLTIAILLAWMYFYPAAGGEYIAKIYFTPNSVAFVVT